MSIYYLLDKTDNGLDHKKIQVSHEENDVVLNVNDQTFQFDIIPLSFDRFSIISNGVSHIATIVPKDDTLLVELGNQSIELMLVDQRHYQSKKKNAQKKKKGNNEIKSPMPGKVVDILVSIDQEVEEGEGLITIEAMKMENELKAPAKGTIKEILVEPGQTVDVSKVLMVFI